MQKTIKTKLMIIGLLAHAVTFFPGVGNGLTIDEAVALALENNPGIQKQQMNRALSEKELSGKKSQNFGKFDVVASYGHYNLPRTLVPLTPASIFGDPTAVPTTEDFFFRITGFVMDQIRTFFSTAVSMAA
jgi:hypothetical protein